MRTLKQLRDDIEAKRVNYSYLANSQQGVIVGAMDLSDLQTEIIADIAEYNRRSKRDRYYGGEYVKR